VSSDAKPALKLHNTIVTWDVYCFSYGHEPALIAVMELIRAGELNATHMKALEQHVAPISPKFRDERPIVAADVSDEDFETLKGLTTQQAYELISKRYPTGVR
jgi:hypothetical protein